MLKRVISSAEDEFASIPHDDDIRTWINDDYEEGKTNLARRHMSHGWCLFQCFNLKKALFQVLFYQLWHHCIGQSASSNLRHDKLQQVVANNEWTNEKKKERTSIWENKIMKEWENEQYILG